MNVNAQRLARLLHPSVLRRDLWNELNPRLPRTLWMYEAGAAVSAFGKGMTLPFILIYLHNVRGFSLGLAGVVAGAYAAASFFGSLAGGAVADRVGAKLVMVGALVATGGGYGWFAFVEHPFEAFAAISIAGLGNGAFLPGQSATIANLAGRERRHGAYAVQRAADNLGIGLGATVGGLIAHTSDPFTFTVLFVLNGTAALLFSLLLVALPLRQSTEDAPPAVSVAEQPASYRAVFRQRLILEVIALNTLYVIGGYALLETALPVFANNTVAINPRGIGIIFLANTLGVVLLQLPIARLSEGRRRLGVLAVMNVGWCAIWAGVLFSGIWLDGSAALAAFIVAVAGFAAGECCLALVSVLVADLAPAQIRARCLSLIPCSYAIGFTVGPALAGFTMQFSQFAIWPIGIGLLAIAAGGGLVVERRLPQEVRVTPERERPAPAAGLREARAAV
jgi:MFS family permease